MPTQTRQLAIIVLAEIHGFDAYAVGDMVLIYIPAMDADRNLIWVIEAVTTVTQTFEALGY